MKLTRIFGLLGAAALLTACDNDDDFVAIQPNPAAFETAQVRFVHASSDAPNVNAANPGAAIAADLAFKEATGLLTVRAGTLNVRVDGIVPGGTANVIPAVDLTLAADTAYDVIALGNVADIGMPLGLDALVLSEPITAVPAGSVRARVVHGAAGAPQVDVHVTAPTTPLDQSAPLGSFSFGEDLGPVEVPAGDYRIRVTAPGVTNAALFDSGTVALPDGADLLIVAVDNTGLGAAPVSLVVADGAGSFEILDAETPAAFRVIHASPDAPNVDVVVNDDFINPVLSDVPFGAFSDYLEVPPATYNVKVTTVGGGLIVFEANLDLEANTSYSVYASDVLANIGPQVLVDDNRSVVTEAKLRIVHQAPGVPGGLVDLYLVAPGTDLADADAVFTDVDFQDETGYVPVAGGMYDIAVTLPGMTMPQIGPLTVTLEDGSVYTVVARDADGGGAPFTVIQMDDF